MDKTFQLGRGTADRVSSAGGAKIVKSSHAVGRFMVDRFAHVLIWSFAEKHKVGTDAWQPS